MNASGPVAGPDVFFTIRENPAVPAHPHTTISIELQPRRADFTVRKDANAPTPSWMKDSSFHAPICAHEILPIRPDSA